MTDNRREAIKRRIRSLLAKTTTAGCTEEEAAKAAALAGDLMAQYDLSYADVHQVRSDSQYGPRARANFVGGSKRRRSYHEVKMCVPYIARFFDCTSFWYLQEKGGMLVYFGTEFDTEAAHLMTEMIRLTMESEFAAYLKANHNPLRKHGRTMRAGFMTGMAFRLNERLEEVKAARTATVNVAGRNALTVIKQELVTEAYAKFLAGAETKKMKTKRKVNADDFEAGQAAAEKIGLIQDRVAAQKVIGC